MSFRYTVSALCGLLFCVSAIAQSVSPVTVRGTATAQPIGSGELNALRADIVTYRHIAGPYVAFPPGDGDRGLEDYVMDLSVTGLPPGTTQATLPSFRFVGGVTGSSDGSAGQMSFEFQDASGSPITTVTVNLANEGNFTYTITVNSPVTIPTDGRLRVFIDPNVAANAGRSVVGQWFLMVVGNEPDPVGSTPGNPGSAPPDGANPRAWAFELTVDAPPLPVELTAFDAFTAGENVTLAWETATETDNAGFFIERSAASLAEGEWTEEAFVEGVGTTVETQRYEHVMRGLAVGTHAFRLRQVDFDGTTSYSEVVEATVEVPGTHAASALYPNPASGMARMSLMTSARQWVRVGVYDVQGRLVTTADRRLVDAQREVNLDINVAGLPRGTYFVRLQGETFTDTRRVVVAK
ncbi:MAG: T9SS type A sorting domain-containing protein [Bacteroidota bacterium]